MTSIDNSSRGDNRNYADQVSLTNESILFDPYSGRAMRPGADVPLRTQSRDSILSNLNNQSLGYLLSPSVSNRSEYRGQTDAASETKLYYQLEAITQKLTERDRKCE